VATTTHLVDTTSIGSAQTLKSPLVLWHLLSLDAPTVAMLWTWFLARSNHILLPVTATFAMGLAVWMLYAADRLLDSRSIKLASTSPSGLEPRHYFHRHHQRAFRFGILLVSCALAVLLPQLAPQSIHLYLILGTLLFGYFLLIHGNSSSPAQTRPHRLPKEIAVGIFFSAAVFIPTVACEPSLRLTLLPAAILFAILCSLNCLFIFSWEHPAPAHQAHPVTNAALRFLIPSAIASISAAIVFAISDRQLPRPVPVAIALSASLLLLLHRNRHRLAPTTLRAAADLCLLTPLLLLHF
jgi:hypothetical protein